MEVIGWWCITKPPNLTLVDLLRVFMSKHFQESISDRGSFPFKRQLDKMVKHTQVKRRLLSKNCLKVFDHFFGLALKELRPIVIKSIITNNFVICCFNSATFNENLLQLQFEVIDNRNIMFVENMYTLTLMVKVKATSNFINKIRKLWWLAEHLNNSTELFMLDTMSVRKL